MRSLVILSMILGLIVIVISLSACASTDQRAPVVFQVAQPEAKVDRVSGQTYLDVGGVNVYFFKMKGRTCILAERRSNLALQCWS